LQSIPEQSEKDKVTVTFAISFTAKGKFNPYYAAEFQQNHKQETVNVFSSCLITAK
jgi:hypothetical protein